MKYFALLLLIPTFALADSATDRDSGFFLGGGFNIAQDLFKFDNGSINSKFQSQGWMLEGGLTWAWHGRFGSQVSAEYGVSSGNNTYASQSTMETGSMKFMTGKASLFFGPVTVGGGLRHNQVEVRSLTITPNAYVETEYEGITPLFFANYSMDIRKRFRTTVELQYISGPLKGSGTTSGTVKFNEGSASLRLYFLFD